MLNFNSLINAIFNYITLAVPNLIVYISISPVFWPKPCLDWIVAPTSLFVSGAISFPVILLAIYPFSNHAHKWPQTQLLGSTVMSTWPQPIKTKKMVTIQQAFNSRGSFKLGWARNRKVSRDKKCVLNKLLEAALLSLSTQVSATC